MWLQAKSSESSATFEKKMLKVIMLALGHEFVRECCPNSHSHYPRSLCAISPETVVGVEVQLSQLSLSSAKFRRPKTGFLDAYTDGPPN